MVLAAADAEALNRIDAALRAAGTAGRAAQEKAYLKSDLLHYGVAVPEMRRIAKSAVPRIANPGRERLVSLVSALWSGIYEHRAVAVELLVLHRGVLAPQDIDVVESLLRTSSTWALVDTLAEKVAGDLVDRFPPSADHLDRWAVDSDFWIRRSALLALLGPLRAGSGDFVRFGRYADVMLDEKEFFVHKAIGWVLRDTAKRRPDLVFDWLLPRAGRASGVTIREAVKPLSGGQRQAIMSAR